MKVIFTGLFLFIISSSFYPITDQHDYNGLKLWELTPEIFFTTQIANRPVNIQQPDNYVLSVAIYQATNLIRKENNLAPLIPAYDLHIAGETHINSMLFYGFFGHTNHFAKEEQTVNQRIKNHGGLYYSVAENLALVHPFTTTGKKYKYRYTKTGIKFFDEQGRPLRIRTYGELAKYIVAEWYNSKGHRKNLLSPDLFYIGVATHITPGNPQKPELPDVYAVQEFGAK